MSTIMSGVYEPALNFRFKVFLVPTATDKKNEQLIKNASDALGFNEISMGYNETEVYEYKEGGENSFTHSFPSTTKAGNLVLSHGVSSDATMGMLRELITKCEDGKFEGARFSMAIGMFAQASPTPSFWYFTDVWAKRMEIGTLSTSDSSAVVIERLELVVKRAELEIAKDAKPAPEPKKEEPKPQKKPEPKPKKKEEEKKPEPKPKPEPEKKPEPKKEEEKKPEPKPKPKKKKADDGWKERNRQRREAQAKKIEAAQAKKGNKDYKHNKYDGTLDNPAEKKKAAKK
jgi:phage tail-like protein